MFIALIIQEVILDGPKDIENPEIANESKEDFI